MHAALAHVGRREPTVVVLDDLQDADHATLDLLAYLAGTLGDVPLLVLGAYRSDELRRDHPLRRLRAELRRAGHLHELTVEPLGAAGTRALAQELLGAPPGEQLASLLYERTDGLPLYIEELVAALRASDRLHDGRDRGSWTIRRCRCPCRTPSATWCCCAPIASVRGRAPPWTSLPCVACGSNLKWWTRWRVRRTRCARRVRWASSSRAVRTRRWHASAMD